ncbi:hypothetical protein IJU85_02955 [Candidatus Saccharibacteria bacterium]|nr:hypothetical protein [Candidatus Saccharibacteria bacterium]
MKKREVFGIIISFIVIAASVTVFLNRVYIKDFFSAMSYEEPERIKAIEESLNLTDRASLMLRASHPSLESEQKFNQNCDSHSQDVSTLGCYANNYIYVYDINHEALDGIVESTMAHELLHAAWQRLDGAEKETIKKLLKDVYENSEYREELLSDLKNYPSEDLVEELHSRIGTEFKKLPDELETYYAKYFKDQDKIVDFYEKYKSEFKKLEAERKEIEEKLKELKNEIEVLTAQYKSDSSALVAEITEFNECANQPGCFSANGYFYEKRAELLERKAKINELYEKIVNFIAEYNNLVEKYDQNVLKNNELFDVMNSNVEKNSLIK